MSCSPSDMPLQSPDLSCELTCRSIVARLQQTYGWKLLEEHELVALVMATAPPDATPRILEQIARDRYSRVLWEMCRQSAAADCREQAYAELQRYLYRAAYNRRPELAAEAVQRALELIVAQVEYCRHPGAFLTFALNKLRHALGEETKWVERLAPAEPPPEPPADDDPLALSVEQYELTRVLIEAIERLADPRQRLVLTLKFFGSLDDGQIGTRLAITPNLVRVLRFRALARLRADQILVQYIGEAAPLM
jgi:RNA polymerase sigma factor (sigma-70 family)